MQHRRSLYWKLNWFRQSELDGALLLGRMVRQAAEPLLIHELTRHCADEARHAWLWERTISKLGLPRVRIFRSYQSFYTEHIELPQSLAEVLSLTHIFEQRVDRQFSEQLARPGLPEEVRRTLRAMLRDEKNHLTWVARWLRSHPDGSTLLDRYRRVDGRVYRQLAPFGERLWEVPGLGEEVAQRHETEETAHAAS